LSIPAAVSTASKSALAWNNPKRKPGFPGFFS